MSQFLAKNSRLDFIFRPWRIACEEKERASRYLNDGIRLAQELSDTLARLKSSEERAERLQAALDKVIADNDNLAKDLLLAARSESMAVERAWHAAELVKLLRARLDLQQHPRGCISE